MLGSRQRTIFDQAVTYYQQANFKQAKYLLEQVVNTEPNHHEALHLLGVLALFAKNYQQAIEYIEDAIALYSQEPGFYINLATAYQQTGNWQQAKKSLLIALSLNPYSLDANFNLGNLYFALNKLTDAAVYYNKALQIKYDHPDVLLNLGAVLQKQEKFEQSIKIYNTVLQYSPDDLRATSNLGLIFMHQGLYAKAKEYFKKTLVLDNSYAPAHNNLGIIYNHEGKLDKATKHFELGWVQNKAHGELLGNLYANLRALCNWQNIDLLSASLDNLTLQNIMHNIKPGETPFININRTDDVRQNFQVASLWSAAVTAKYKHVAKFVIAKKTRAHNAKIRLGYLSADFYNHATAYLINGLIKLHNRNEFEVYLYSYGKDMQDDYSNSLKNNCDKFIDIQALDNYNAANNIFHDNIDILIDLKGYTRYNRIGICALKPAPIQISYLGFPGTSGADFFDYIITDNIVTPKYMQQYYSEKFLYMPNSYQVTDSTQRVSNIKFTRKDFKIPDGACVFCSFNQFNKLDTDIINSWVQILNNVPGSVLWLWESNAYAVKLLRDYFHKMGCAKDRVFFAKELNRDQHLARIQLADIALDTFIYNGHTTTSDALFMGVPVITLQGKHFASRVSSSLLTGVNLPECITYSIDEYINKAIYLANNQDKLDALKSKLHRNKATCSLFDTKLFAKNIENIYSTVFKSLYQ